MHTRPSLAYDFIAVFGGITLTAVGIKIDQPIIAAIVATTTGLYIALSLYVIFKELGGKP